MSIARAVKRKARAAVPPLVFLSLTAYFLWQATQGDRGLDAATQRRRELAAAQADLAAAEADLAAWQHRVEGLQNSHIDPDALDERARAMLNLSDPTDIIVPYGAGKKLF